MSEKDLMRGEYSEFRAAMRTDSVGSPGSFVQAESAGSGTSIFDPVLCELAYRWFCPPGGIVLDPFAGGSVRGIVAAMLGLRYIGIDLSERQIAANTEQWAAIGRESDLPAPSWIAGDAINCVPVVLGPVDFVFSCPPYADLERYSDDPRDLSTLAWPDFCSAYRKIIAAAIDKLAPDRFACFVVGEVRDEKGFYRGLVPETIGAFEAAGARLYNEAILITAIGSLAIRVGRQFEVSRKLGKTHQNALVFCKGDPRAATDACGEVVAGRDFDIGEAPIAAPAEG